MLRRATTGSGVTKLTFAIPAEQVPGSVSVVGDFNGWDPAAHPLKKRSNGTRSATVQLPSGRAYAFKYLTDDGTWFCDPEVETVDNGQGQLNSLVTT